MSWFQSLQFSFNLLHVVDRVVSRLLIRANACFFLLMVTHYMWNNSRNPESDVSLPPLKYCDKPSPFAATTWHYCINCVQTECKYNVKLTLSMILVLFLLFRDRDRRQVFVQLRTVIPIYGKGRDSLMRFMNLVVGGSYFSIDVTDLADYPECYFSLLLKDEWCTDKATSVNLDRDGDAFQYVHHFLFAGVLGPVAKVNGNLEKLLRIKREADYYNLPTLVKLCDNEILDSLIATCRDCSVVHPSYECVVETAAGSTDQLTAALRPLRKPTVSTARLNSYAEDELVHGSIDSFIKAMRWVPGNHLGENFVNCKHISVQEIEPNRLTALKKAFSCWPLAPDLHVNQTGLTLNLASMYVYQEEGLCTDHTPTSQCTGHILYIFNSDHTGGRVSTMVNGEVVSINQPGEYMAIVLGGTYTVEKVTSGVMILIVFPIYAEFNTAAERIGQEELRLFPEICSQFNEEQSNALLNAVLKGLSEYDRLVFCLSNYYAPRISEDNDRCFETDVNLLNELELSVHNLLCKHGYNVSVVTVYISKEVHMSRVLDFAHPTESSIASLDEIRYKIVAPLFGCGEMFPTELYPTDLESYGTLLSGLLVQRG